MTKHDVVLFVNPKDVTAQIFDDEAVVINFATSVYYTLEGAAAFAWGQFEGGCTAAEAAARVSAHFGVDAQLARTDMDALVADLLKEQLIVEGVAGSNSGAGKPSGSGGKYATPRITAYRDMSDILALDPPLPELRPVPEANDKR